MKSPETSLSPFSRRRAVSRAPLRLFAPLTLLLAAIAPAHAHTFCVGTSAELTAALASAGGTYKNEDSAIQIKHGTYIGEWGYSVANTHSIALIGGFYDFFGGCVADSVGDPALTVLDGNGANQVLHIALLAGSSGSVAITALTFAHGSEAFNGYGGGVTVLAGGATTNNVLIERSVFAHNTNSASIGSSAALAVSTGGIMTIRNNVFVGNTAPVAPAMNLYNNGGHAYVTNNTVAYNVLTAAPVNNAAVKYDGSGAAYALFVNNIILYVNDAVGDDVSLNSRMTMIDNDWGASNGVAEGSSIGNVHVDPKFVDELGEDFRLLPTSPLINLGDDTTSAFLGGASAFDLDGNPRIVGVAIDVGAYESDVLFANGFDPTL